MTDREVGSMTAALCDPLELSPSCDALDVFDALNELDCFGLRGGVAVLVDSQIVVSRGCCTGIEDWRELHDILKCESPWMGHDPAPWCEFPDQNSVRFWADGGGSCQHLGPTVLFSQTQIAEELQQFHNALLGTVQRFRQWLAVAGCRCTDSLVEKFDQSLAITSHEPLYKIVT